MQTRKVGDYTIKAWAEQIAGGGWHGLASIHPAIPNTWTGGPNGDSLLCDGAEATEIAAENAAIVEALAALAASGMQKISGTE